MCISCCKWIRNSCMKLGGIVLTGPWRPEEQKWAHFVYSRSTKKKKTCFFFPKLCCFHCCHCFQYSISKGEHVHDPWLMARQDQWQYFPANTCTCNPPNTPIQHVWFSSLLVLLFWFWFVIWDGWLSSLIMKLCQVSTLDYQSDWQHSYAVSRFFLYGIDTSFEFDYVLYQAGRLCHEASWLVLLRLSSSIISLVSTIRIYLVHGLLQ